MRTRDGPCVDCRRSVFRAAVVAIAVLASSAPAAAGADDTVAAVPVVSTMRDTGYTVGDLVRRRIEFVLPQGAALDERSLPAPGRVARWLELREMTVQDVRGMRPVLSITYQIFGVPEAAVRVSIPEFKVGVTGLDKPWVVVPSQPMLLSPVLPPELDGELKTPRPAPPPEPLPVGRHVAAMLAGVLAASAGAFALLWIHDLIPFLPRHPGEMTRLWRRWRGRRDGLLDESERRLLLEEFHRALSGCAGETLYPATLARLFNRATHLQPLREAITTAFSASWRSIYGPSGSGGAPDAAALLALIRSAADRERGWR